MMGSAARIVKLGPLNGVINLGVSVTKTLLVMAVFMHETEARKLTRLVSVLGVFCLAKQKAPAQLALKRNGEGAAVLHPIVSRQIHR